MLIFLSGGSASGKSALAERVCCALPGPHIYIATMPVRSPEDERKVARHHALRADRGFAQTLEMPGRLGDVPPEATVLFECLSTFTANRMFDREPAPDMERAPTAAQQVPSRDNGWEAALWAELQEKLLSRSGHTVIVSAEVGCDGAVYDDYTEAYRAVLTGLGCRLAAAADVAAEAVCGRAVVHKGQLPATP